MREDAIFEHDLDFPQASTFKVRVVRVGPTPQQEMGKEG
jgi:hypothetical protein